MALPASVDEWVNYLSIQHDQELPELEELNRYYEGKQPISYMHPEVFQEVNDRIRPVVIAWPQLVVDTLEERLDVEGFRVQAKDESELDLWRVWQANDMDEQSQMAHVDSLVMRRAYVAVGTNEDDADTPLVTAESPLEMFADIDPRTRKVRGALRRVGETDSFARVAERHATLYLPDRTVWLQWVRGSWQEEATDLHRLGEVPVVPLVNRARLSSRVDRMSHGRRVGRSELEPIIPLSDAANKIATDMMVAAEFVALPIRGLFGIGPDDLEDQDGNKLTAIQTLLKRLLTIPTGVDEGAKEFEFAPANLTNFHSSIESLAQLVMSVAALTPSDMGFTTANPASADAIRSNEIRKIKRCERKQRPLGGGYERTGRLIRRFQSGDWDPSLLSLETVWRDPSTPTVAQSADAALKLYEAQPRPIVPLRQTRQKLGFSETQIASMEAQDEEEARRDPLGQIARDVHDRV